MKVVPLDHGLLLGAPTEGYVRTPGVHMSELYNSLYKGLNPRRFDKRDADGKPFPFDDLRVEVGTAFEELLEPVLRQRIITAERPGEYATQHVATCIHWPFPVSVGDPVCSCGAGIIYTPDHFLFNGTFRVGELKVTWMSIAKGLSDRRFDKWFTQLKSYCYHLQTPYARLYALFINGDYRSYSPALLAWDITFTAKELAEEWHVLLRHGKKTGMIPV